MRTHLIIFYCYRISKMNYRPRTPLNPLESKSFFPTSTMQSPHKRPTHDISEVENIIDYQRQKFINGKNSLQAELERERQKRLELENKLLRLKEEFSKKESVIMEMEYKFNNILHENQDLRIECTKYKAELDRLQQLYGQKIQELERELEGQRMNFDETTNLYNEEFQKFKKQGQDYVDRLTFEYEKKIKTLEDKGKFAQNSKREYQSEIKKLNDALFTSKINYDEIIREMTLKSREDQAKKSHQMSKSYEQRLRSAEESKEQLSRKNQDLLRVIQQKQQNLQNNERDKHDQVAHLEHEISDLHGKIQHMSYMLDKANNDAYERATAKVTRDVVNVDESIQLKQQLQQRRREIQDKNTAIRELKQVLKESSAQSERKRVELQERCQYFEAESRKYKDQYTKICDTLKSKINQTIASVSTYQRP